MAPYINLTIDDRQGNNTTATGTITDPEILDHLLVVHDALTQLASKRPDGEKAQ